MMETVLDASDGFDAIPIPNRLSRLDMVVNGRFFHHRTVTGVQRYAREIVLAMDQLLKPTAFRSSIVLPAGTSVDQSFAAFDIRPLGPFTGHLWEQTTLPTRCRSRILNLCNTAPALKSDQVVCIHDANVFISPDSYSRAFRTMYQNLLPQLARHAAKVTTVSKTSASQLAAHLPIAIDAIAVLPNGHEHVMLWDAARSTLASRFDFVRPFVLLLGSRARHKNAKLILNQAEALDALGLDLVVVGGSDKIFAEIGTVAGPNVIHLGGVSDDDLAFLYGRAFCLAFPSFTEGFGLPLVEAMALGCPIVSSDRASMPEVCGPAALIASPDDADAWNRHFAALVGSSSLRGELRERGALQVLNFSWTSSARGYLALLGCSL